MTWRIKVAYDDYHRRQRQELEMVRMAARPFNSITLRCDQDARFPFNKFLDNDPPTTVCKQPFHGDKLAVVSFVVWLPGTELDLTYTPQNEDGFENLTKRKYIQTPYNQTAIGVGSTLVKMKADDTEFGPNALPFESIVARKKRQVKEKKRQEKARNEMLQHVDPQQSKNTTKRIEKWLTSQPEKPEEDLTVVAGSGIVTDPKFKNNRTR